MDQIKGMLSDMTKKLSEKMESQISKSMSKITQDAVKEVKAK